MFFYYVYRYLLNFSRGVALNMWLCGLYKLEVEVNVCCFSVYKVEIGVLGIEVIFCYIVSLELD